MLPAKQCCGWLSYAKLPRLFHTLAGVLRQGSLGSRDYSVARQACYLRLAAHSRSLYLLPRICYTSSVACEAVLWLIRSLVSFRIVAIKSWARQADSSCKSLQAVLGPAKPPQAGSLMQSRIFAPRRSRLSCKALHAALGPASSCQASTLALSQTQALHAVLG
jgi:hypothetical protein